MRPISLFPVLLLTSPVLIAALALGVGFRADVAAAACPEATEPSGLLLYPTDAAQDVPTNARAFFFADGDASLVLNGETFAAASSPMALPNLSPSTSQAMALIVSKEGATDRFFNEVFFETGREEAMAPPQITITGVSSATLDSSQTDAGCQTALRWRFCDDTESSRWRTISVATLRQPVLWRVSRVGHPTLFLPGHCPPEVVDLSGSDSGCATLVAINAAGEESPPASACWGEGQPPPVPQTGAGDAADDRTESAPNCTSTGATTTTPVMVGLLSTLLLSWMKRRRRVAEGRAAHLRR